MAIGADIGSIVSGALSTGVSAPDMTAIFQQIQNAGANQRQLIDALPAELQQQYAAYIASNGAASSALSTGTTALGQNLLAQTQANYGPNAPAVQAAIDAMKTQTYANVPGQQNAIREALAATGGFDRGTATKQLSAPVIQAAGQVGQGIQNITVSQLQQKQQATQQALNTINSMNDQVLQQQFGLSRDQA